MIRRSKDAIVQSGSQLAARAPQAWIAFGRLCYADGRKERQP